MRALYDYEAQGPDEIDIRNGEIIELTEDGQNYAEGWWEGKCPVMTCGYDVWCVVLG